MATQHVKPKGRDLAALFVFIESRASTPHAWGRRKNDCVSFAAGAVKAQTGRHRLGDLSWTTRAGALQVLDREGGLEAAVDKRYRRIAAAAAMRGDIAAVADPLLGIRLMIVEGEMLVGPGAAGNRRLKRSAMVAAWSATDPADGAA